MSFCNGIISSDPHSWGVCDCRHGGLFAFLLLAVDDEEQEEEDDQQNQDDDPCYGSDLIGVHMHGGTGEAVEVPYHHTSLITARSFPAWIAVAGPGHVITGGVIQTVAHLTTPITVRTRWTLLLAVASHEARAAGALSGYVVTVGSIPALTSLSTVFPIETQWAALGAVQAGPPWRTLALPIIGAAEGSVVTVACVDAVGAPLTRRTGLRAVTPDPSRVALAGAIDGVTGSIVCATAAPSTVLPKVSTGAHLVTQCTFEAWQAVALSGDVVAGAVTVDALWTGLTAAVAEITWRADSLTGGASVARGAFTGAFIRGTGRPVLTVTG